MVCSINWIVTAKLLLKLFWVFKGMRTITFKIIKTKTFGKHSLRFSKRDIASFVRSSFWQSFSNQETSKNVNLWSILWARFLRLWFWIKASLLHLIFILCNLFCVEALCSLLWSCWSVICLLFSITGFVIELVQWVLHWSHICRGVQ